MNLDNSVSFLLEGAFCCSNCLSSIATVDGLDYKEAEAKYRQQPPVNTEKELMIRKS